MRVRVSLLLAPTLACAVLLAGCGAPDARTAITPAPTPAATPEVTQGATSAVRAMSIEQRRTLIAPNFQIEVPVPVGEVVRGEAQGDTAWDYELVVAARPAEVANWYREAYGGREWQLVEQAQQPEGTLVLVLTKNAAQTRVTITPEGADKSRVKAVLGVGTPVLETQ